MCVCVCDAHTVFFGGWREGLGETSECGVCWCVND